MLPRPKEGMALVRQCNFLLKQLNEAIELSEAQVQSENGDKKFPRSANEPTMERCRDLRRWYEAPVKRGIRDLRIAGNPLSWLLSSEDQKQRAFSACNYLYDVLTLGLGPGCQEVLKELSRQGQFRTKEK